MMLDSRNLPQLIHYSKQVFWIGVDSTLNLEPNEQVVPVGSLSFEFLIFKKYLMNKKINGEFSYMFFALRREKKLVD